MYRLHELCPTQESWIKLGLRSSLHLFPHSLVSGCVCLDKGAPFSELHEDTGPLLSDGPAVEYPPKKGTIFELIPIRLIALAKQT